MFSSEYYFVPRDKHDNQESVQFVAKETPPSDLAYTHLGGTFTFVESVTQHVNSVNKGFSVDTDHQCFVTLSMQTSLVCIMGFELKTTFVFLIIFCVT